MPSWSEFQPFIVTGLALGGVYALSGVGIVVLFRATGVLNLAFGAVGAMGALIAWQMSVQWKLSEWLGYAVCIAFAAVLTLVYGLVFGPPLAGRDPLVKAVATLGLTLVLLGAMDILWTTSGGAVRSLILPTDSLSFSVGQITIDATQVLGLALGVAITVFAGVFLRFTKLGTAMRAVATDREITATLGVPVRRVEAVAWLGCGALSGLAGVLLADLVALDATTLTFLVISTLAAALIARLSSITVTLLAAIVVGLVESMSTPIQAITNYSDMAPFVLAAVGLVILTLRRREFSASRGG